MINAAQSVAKTRTNFDAFFGPFGIRSKKLSGIRLLQRAVDAVGQAQGHAFLARQVLVLTRHEFDPKFWVRLARRVAFGVDFGHAPVNRMCLLDRFLDVVQLAHDAACDLMDHDAGVAGDQARGARLQDRGTRGVGCPLDNAAHWDAHAAHGLDGVDQGGGMGAGAAESVDVEGQADVVRLDLLLLGLFLEFECQAKQLFLAVSNFIFLDRACKEHESVHIECALRTTTKLGFEFSGEPPGLNLGDRNFAALRIADSDFPVLAYEANLDYAFR